MANLKVLENWFETVLQKSLEINLQHYENANFNRFPGEQTPTSI